MLLIMYIVSRLSAQLQMLSNLILQMLMNAHSCLLVMQMLCVPTRLGPTHVPAATATLAME